MSAARPSRPRLDPQRVTVVPLGTAAVLFDLRTYRATRANPVAARAVALADGTRTVPAIAAALATEFAIPRRGALADLRRLLVELERRRFLATGNVARAAGGAPPRAPGATTTAAPAGATPRAPPGTSIDVEVGGLRVRLDSEVPELDAACLGRVFAGHAAPPRPRPGAWLRVVPAPPPRAWREPARLGPRAAAALLPLPDRLRASPGRRHELTHGLAARLGVAPVTERAELALADAVAPVAFPWGNGAFAGDLALPRGTLFLAAWRAPRDFAPPLLNAHGLLLATLAIRRGGLLAHSAAVVVGGVAWLLVGRSGVGKTTLSRRARGAALSDDGVLVVPRRGRFVAAGTPLRQLEGGGARWGRGADAGVPLGGVLLLRQARRNAVRPVSPAAALAEIASRHLHFLALLPPELATRAVGNVAALLTATPVHRLDFTRDADLGQVLRTAGVAAPTARAPRERRARPPLPRPKALAAAAGSG